MGTLQLQDSNAVRACGGQIKLACGSTLRPCSMQARSQLSCSTATVRSGTGSRHPAATAGPE